MRYFTFNEFYGDTGTTVTISEEDIRKEYYPYWYEQMCKKYGKDHVDENYTFEDCLMDWSIIHWAWESDANDN